MRSARHCLAMAGIGACGECRVASGSTAVGDGGGFGRGPVGASGKYLVPGYPGNLENRYVAEGCRPSIRSARAFSFSSYHCALAARVAARMPPPEITEPCGPLRLYAECREPCLVIFDFHKGPAGKTLGT